MRALDLNHKLDEMINELDNALDNLNYPDNVEQRKLIEIRVRLIGLWNFINHN